MEFPFSSSSLSETDTETIAKSFAKSLSGGEVVVLSGELGAGKTFFIKKTILNFGISWVNSPTFAIVNEYSNSLKFYHIDFYRVKTVRELFDIGFDDYLNDSDAVTFIEWGNLFPQVLPQKRIETSITVNQDLSREIRIVKHV